MRKKQRANDTDKQISKIIREKRIEKGLTCSDLAKAVNVSYQQMQKYETGVNRISAGNLFILAEYLKIDIREMLPKQKEI